ncbi:hypothetical protein [Comamonas thiooxydans]|uniref:hypothetical protein n=1 Tax=Comamonas thiooxydans TaxID=363952 RepID=UPI0011872B39|nr:hypothetical protein [Comamonas thiooxydans]
MDQLAKLSCLPQRQDGTNDQLQDLQPFACKLGMYEAAKYADHGMKRQPLTERLKAELAKLDQQAHRIDPVADQLRDLRIVANRLGLYDAADFLRLTETRAQAALATS